VSVLSQPVSPGSAGGAPAVGLWPAGLSAPAPRGELPGLAPPESRRDARALPGLREAPAGSGGRPGRAPGALARPCPADLGVSPPRMARRD